MTFIIMTEGLDLSMGAVLGLAGVVLALALVGNRQPMSRSRQRWEWASHSGWRTASWWSRLGYRPLLRPLDSRSGPRNRIGPDQRRECCRHRPGLPRLYASTWIGLPFSSSSEQCCTPLFTFCSITPDLGITCLRSVVIARRWFWPASRRDLSYRVMRWLA